MILEDKIGPKINFADISFYIDENIKRPILMHNIHGATLKKVPAYFFIPFCNDKETYNKLKDDVVDDYYYRSDVLFDSFDMSKNSPSHKFCERFYKKHCELYNAIGEAFSTNSYFTEKYDSPFDDVTPTFYAIDRQKFNLDVELKEKIAVFDECKLLETINLPNINNCDIIIDNCLNLKELTLGGMNSIRIQYNSHNVGLNKLSADNFKNFTINKIVFNSETSLNSKNGKLKLLNCFSRGPLTIDVDSATITDLYSFYSLPKIKAWKTVLTVNSNREISIGELKSRYTIFNMRTERHCEKQIIIDDFHLIGSEVLFDTGNLSTGSLLTIKIKRLHVYDKDLVFRMNLGRSYTGDKFNMCVEEFIFEKPEYKDRLVFTNSTKRAELIFKQSKNIQSGKKIKDIW